jgi:hypothetical protein
VARPLILIVLATLFCAALAWLVFSVLGAFTIAIAAPLYGALVARPIIDLVAASNYAAKSAALSDVQGKWYQHRGHRINIAEDIENARWLLTSHVRGIVHGLPRDEVLSRQFEGRAGHVEKCEGFRIRADALAEYLAKSTDSRALKLKVWLDREVRGGSRNPRLRPQSKANV